MARIWSTCTKTRNGNSRKMKDTLRELLKVEHGFKPMELAAQEMFASMNARESMAAAMELLKDSHYQIRSTGVFILGFLAAKHPKALQILKNEVSRDESWQVQEILAKAFDRYCSDIGYGNALPAIKEWLGGGDPRVCRAVIEGLRIWTGREYFNTHPEEAVRLISPHRGSENEYLRKSVGNALRDISKRFGDLVERETASWDLSDRRVLFTYKLVIKGKKKSG